MIISGTPDELQKALVVKDAIERHRKQVASVYWLYATELAIGLGVNQVYQCKN